MLNCFGWVRFLIVSISVTMKFGGLGFMGVDDGMFWLRAFHREGWWVS